MEDTLPTVTGDVWGETAPEEAVRQLADLVAHKFSALAMLTADDGRGFRATPKDAAITSGILSIDGALQENRVVRVAVELVRTAQDVRVPGKAFFQDLAALGDKCRLTTAEQPDGTTSLGVEIRVQATPMSVSRQNAFLQELVHVEELAAHLQTEVPQPSSAADLRKKYEPVADVMEPVLPLSLLRCRVPPEVEKWAAETIEFLQASLSVAVAVSAPAMEHFVAALLAQYRHTTGSSLGRLIAPTISAKGLVELARKAPGTVLVPAASLNLGSNMYEMGHEVASLLALLSSAGTPMIFCGSIDQLQEIFHGGQGGVSDPLAPVVRHVPDIPLEVLALHQLRAAAGPKGGLSAANEKIVVQHTLDALAERPAGERLRLLHIVAGRTLAAWNADRRRAGAVALAFAATAARTRETLSGLTATPRVARSPDVQQHLVHALTDPSLYGYFTEQLIAQDVALRELTARLRTEVLARPLHQPLRYCAQGTPGTGKSESAVLLAQRLAIPYVNIDAASMPDYYTAAAQLLGSGRGIVGSFKSGRLEQAAKHHAGAVIEVSDLDHAVPIVRCALADLFLQILETGEAQSATGAMFSCANLIFAFTMNLPGGADEKVHRTIGFNGQPSRRDVGTRVTVELKQMLSGAFLSRVGTVILFEPLGEVAMATIVERTLAKAAGVTCERLGLSVIGVSVAAGTGRAVLAALDTDVTAFGARALHEHSRTLASEAILECCRSGADLCGCVLLLQADAQGRLQVRVVAATPAAPLPADVATPETPPQGRPATASP